MGVCAGLGRHTGIDPVVFRAGFVVLLLGSGIGLFVYLAAYLLMKEPNGRPGLIEQWTRRDFDAEAVMALLTAVLGFGLAINLATVWLDAGTLVVGVFLAVSLLAAHASGVDLRALARSMPERLSRRRDRERDAASDESPAPTAAAPPAPVRAAEPDPGATMHPGAAAPMRAAEPEPAAPVRLPEPDVAPGAPAPPTIPVQRPATPPPAANVPPAVPSARPAPAYEVANDATAVHETLTPPSPAEEIRESRPAPAREIGYRSYDEPFAPNGPFQPLDPARREGGYSPYDPARYGRPVPKRRRQRSFIGFLTILLSLIIGGIVVAVQARSAAGVSPTIVFGAMLITIGAGLLVAAWWGRGAGLVAAGTAVTLIVGMGLLLGGMPRNIGPTEWTPTTITEASQLFDVGLGDGLLDLSELELPPGSDVTINAAVSAGELVVIVPPTARVEVNARNKIGDIVIDQSLRGGVDIRTSKVLEPEVKPKGELSTIKLNLRGGFGDMEVRRAA